LAERLIAHMSRPEYYPPVRSPTTADTLGSSPSINPLNQYSRSSIGDRREGGGGEQQACAMVRALVGASETETSDGR
jgi:hypothetical protein